MKIAASIFKTFFLSLCVIANTHFAYAQTASILPQGKTQFLDNNGKPLTSGTVDFYTGNVSSTTRKATWQNSGETVTNTNPVVLDAGGRAIIYGDGSYRQVVKDRLGNLIWDQLTSSTGGGSGGGSAATGDGDLVGTIKPWAGMTAPNQYVFTYGQEVSRSTFSVLFTAITSSQAVFCNSGSPTLTGLTDTTNFPIGAPVELSCVAAGFSTIVSKTSSTITLAANANVSTNTTAIIFPWGNGNHTNTFNIPDFRGVPIAGNNNMGGVASGNITATYFGTDPNSVGALGGSQTHTLVSGEQTAHSHPVFLTDPGHSHGVTNVKTNTFSGGAVLALTLSGNPSSLVTDTNQTGLNIRDTTAGAGTANQTNTNFGGIANTATVGNVGSGYTNGSQVLTITGGVCTIQPQYTVTVAGGALSGTPTLLTGGDCTIAPPNPAVFTGGGAGTGGTLNIIYLAKPFSLIQPTKTANYIIKTTPDTNSASASGVTKLGGMTGDIACGSGLLCTGNIISTVGGGGTVTSVALTAPSIFTVTGSPVITAGTLGLVASGTSGGVPYFNSSTTMASSAALTASAIMLGGGAGGAPTVLGSLGTSTTLLHGNAGGSPAFSSVVSSDLNITTSTCTNQFVTAISATAVATCTTDTLASAQHANQGTTTTVLHGNAAGNPSWAAVVSADLNITTTTCTNQFVTAISSTGTGTCTTDVLASAQHANQGTTTTVLHGNAAGNPSFGAVNLGTDVTGVTPIANGGTSQSTALTARGSSGLNIDEATSTGDANYTILATDRMVYHTALSAARTDTLPAANTVNAGQQFVINDFRGVASGANTVTLLRNGADTVNGVTSVVAINAQYGAGIFWSDGVSRWTFQPSSSGGGSGTVTQVNCGNQTITSTGTCQTDSGLGIQNCGLVASVSANILTVNLTDAAGATPSATSPCRINFRSATAAPTAGNPIVTSNYTTAALSITTNATGATLGSTNSKAFRFWVVAFDNAGTTVLSLYNAVTQSTFSCAGINETTVQSSTAISGSATSTATYYTPNGTTLASKAIRIVGYIEYNSTGLTTAGTYASAPSFIQMFGYGVAKPCTELQSVDNIVTADSGSSTGTFVVNTGFNTSITPSSAANLITAEFTGPLQTSAAGMECTAQLSRGTTNASGLIGVPQAAFVSTAGIVTAAHIKAKDYPNTTSSQAYAAQRAVNVGAGTCNFPTGSIGTNNGLATLKEIMG